MPSSPKLASITTFLFLHATGIFEPLWMPPGWILLAVRWGDRPVSVGKTADPSTGGCVTHKLQPTTKDERPTTVSLRHRLRCNPFRDERLNHVVCLDVPIVRNGNTA